MEVEVPGGKATLRDPSQLKERQRRLMTSAVFKAMDILDRIPDDIKDMKPEDQQKAMKALKLEGDDTDRLTAVQDAAILALLESWTLSIPLPKTVDELLDLPGDLYDAIAEAAKEPASKISQKSFSPTPDPKSPTGPSSASATA